MLYDPKWEQPQVKAEPFSLESLIAWLELQPAGKSYDFFCQGSCLVGQWLRSLDEESGPAYGQGASYYVVNSEVREFNYLINNVANDGDNRFTFGAALDRARELAER